MLTTVYAAINNPAIGSLGNQNAVSFTEGMIRALIQLGLVAGGVIFIFMFLVGGIKWITSGGDKGQMESARKTLGNAIIGIVVVFCLYAVVNIVGCFFGINLLEIKVGRFDVSFGAGICKNTTTTPPNCIPCDNNLTCNTGFCASCVNGCLKCVSSNGYPCPI
jgi:cbb3-type cytochrome oxidase subunit 3